MSSLRVLVYGSLREGMGNDIKHFARRLDLSMVKRGLAKFKGRMYSLGGYPYVSFNKTDDELVGEVYEIDDPEGAMLSSLDRLEGYPHFYDRKEIDTEYGPAFVYFFHKDVQGPPRVEHGDWVRFRKYGYT